MMPKTYKHLDANERDTLAVLKCKGRSLREISTMLKRSPSTLSRELERNAPPVYTGYYLSHKAQERADKRNRESHRRPRLDMVYRGCSFQVRNNHENFSNLALSGEATPNLSVPKSISKNG